MKAGSPPRVREKRIVATIASLIGRITPASAGKTALTKDTQVAVQDHPRECGKNQIFQLY